MDQASVRPAPGRSRRRPAPISDRATFDALRRGRRSRNGPITVSWVPSSQADVWRVGYAIGRRVGNAVQRNLVRRRLRSVVADVIGDLPPGAYLISARPAATTMSFAQLQDALSQAMGAVAGGTARRSAPPAGPIVQGVCRARP